MSVYHGPRPTPTNYSKFDRIVDSDDEDDVTTRPGGPPASLDHFAKAMPPHLYRKLTEAQMATASGDHAAALRAQQELNDELERGPQEFRDAMAQAQRLRGSGGRTSAKDTSGLTAHEVRAQLQEQSAKLAQLEQVEHLQDQPEEMARVLMASGLTPEMLAEAEASEHPEAMRRLAERMVAATMGGEVGMGALGRESTPADARVCRRWRSAGARPRPRAAPPQLVALLRSDDPSVAACLPSERRRSRAMAVAKALAAELVPALPIGAT